MNSKEKMVICPDCFGDGIETCHNPDHGFLHLIGMFKSPNDGACPACGHNIDHKMKGKCYTCNGTGKVTLKEYNDYIEEFVPKEDIEMVNEHCLVL